MLIRSGIKIIKFWFSVSFDEQEKRFLERIKDPTKNWKLSEMDLQSRVRWDDYSRAKDEMFTYTDTKQCPWWVVNSDDKKKARLNCISHLLSEVPYKDVVLTRIQRLPDRDKTRLYLRSPIEEQTFIPEVY
jgi:polyphosphate kinase 2 (PPK2 family)